MIAKSSSNEDERATMEESGHTKVQESMVKKDKLVYLNINGGKDEN